MAEQINGSAIKEIERIVQGAQKTSILEVGHEPDGVYYLVGANGNAERKIAAPDWHTERLATPVELRSFIEHQKRDTSAVFLDDNRAVFIYELEDRRHRAACELLLTPQYVWLVSNGGKQMTQPELVRTLRITFRGCLVDQGALLTLVRNLKFNQAADGSMNIQHGTVDKRESLGRSIVSQVSGEAQIPEEVALDVPIYENHVFATRIVCAIEIFPEAQRFALTPYPLETRRALDRALQDVEDLLAAGGEDGADLPKVFRGKPE